MSLNNWFLNHTYLQSCEADQKVIKLKICAESKKTILVLIFVYPYGFYGGKQSVIRLKHLLELKRNQSYAINPRYILSAGDDPVRKEFFAGQDIM